MNEFNQSLNRIRIINWSNIEKDKKSFPLLVSEFIIRGNIFRDIYEKQNKKRLAVFNATDIINEFIPLEVKCCIDELKLLEQGWTIKLLCSSYLEWMYLSDKEVDAVRKYHDLYEPIIKLFERGGRISYHQNELICGKFGWPRNCYKSSRISILKEINDKVLDEIDLKKTEQGELEQRLLIEANIPGSKE